MDEFGINGITAAILTLFVAGFVDFVKYLFQRDWEKAITIGIAGLAGGIGGLILGLGVILGVCGGFAASGLITVVKRVGDY